MEPLLGFVVFPSLALALVLYQWPRERRRLESALLAIAGAGTLLHVALQGHRWQFMPLYAIALGASILPVLKQRWQWLVSASMLLLGVTSAGILWAFPVARGFPPSGPFAVGTKILHWTDTSRDEWFTDEDGDERELMVQLWYPSNPNAEHVRAAYFDYPELRANPLAESLGLPTFTMAHLSEFRSHSFFDAPLNEEVERWPVIVFSHGLEGTRSQNTSLMEALASHGYIVAAPDHAYDSFLTIFPNTRRADFRSDVPDGISDEEWLRLRGRQLDTRVADMSFVLERLTSLDEGENDSHFFRRLDLNTVGIVGHSFGGATAVLAARADPRWRAVIALDGWFVPIDLPGEQLALTQPLLYMGQASWPEWYEERHREQLALLIKNSAVAYHLSLPESRHSDFTDLPMFSPLTRALGLTGSIEAERMVPLVNSHVIDFFNHYLAGKDLEVLGPRSEYTEVHVEAAP